jgi:SAM-dependent methyltransferase
MTRLVPDQLKDLWQSVERGELSAEEFSLRQEGLLAGYRNTWEQALLLEGHAGLEGSLLYELSRYVGCSDLAEIRRRCQAAVETVKGEWPKDAARGERQAVEAFYDQSRAMIYELMGWHTLAEDVSPLGYVTALEFARERGCRSHLDFGAGVGAGSILFARHGLATTLADISTPLQQFCRWRLELRRLPARLIDLKAGGLPKHAFDIVTAMDVFEHLVDPVRVVEEVGAALQPQGYLFARLHAEIDEQRPQHIVTDFGPTFRRLRESGFVQVWQDEWLWGHQVFQKS